MPPGLTRSGVSILHFRGVTRFLKNDEAVRNRRERAVLSRCALLVHAHVDAAARWHGVAVSSPYFLPMPIGIGTLGAFVRMRSEPTDRRQLFDIAIAGPLAGLVASLIAVAIGASGSPAIERAGMMGLVLTAFNLIPVGQLDGGHIARAWFVAARARWIGRVVLGAMIAIGILAWHPMLLWALVAYAFSATGDTAGDASAAPRIELGRARRALGWTAAVALGVLVPVVIGGGSPCPLA